MILKTKDLRDKTEAQLNEELNSLQDKLFQARMNLHSRKLENTSSLKQLRKSIARILTILKERSKA